MANDDTIQTRLGIDTEPTTRVGHVNHDTEAIDEYIGRTDNGTGHLNSIEIGDPGWLGNPYPKREHGRAECIELFREDFEDRLEDDERFREAIAELQGHVLGCYCQRLHDASPRCHGEVIAEHADRLGRDD